MSTRFTKRLKRSPLSAFAFAAIIIAITVAIMIVPQTRVASQTVPFNRLAPTVQLAQARTNAVVAVESAGMTVADMDRAVEFYTQVLSFKKVSDVEVLGKEYEQLQGLFGVRLRIVKMQLGNELIELTEYLTPKGRPIPIESRSNDRWFQHIAIVVSDMDSAYQHLRRSKVQYASTAPQRIPDTNQAAAGIRAFYFRDPDGHFLEVIYFPSGKGDPKWQNPTDQLFLGIDHTAIAISNTEISSQFYDGLLSMKLTGESLNYGSEQDQLDHIYGARVLITSHQPTQGPGIEFLNYLQPTDARPMPPDTQANDIIHWQIRMVVRDAAALAQRLKAAGVRFVSSGVVLLSDEKLGFYRGFQVLDPDGHAIQITEK